MALTWNKGFTENSAAAQNKNSTNRKFATQNKSKRINKSVRYGGIQNLTSLLILVLLIIVYC